MVRKQNTEGVLLAGTSILVCKTHFKLLTPVTRKYIHINLSHTICVPFIAEIKII